MKAFQLLLVVLLIAAAVVGQRFYAYVTNTESPFDEVGIGLLGYAPGPIRDWGCGRLKETFGATTLPPYGCGTEDGRHWR